MDSPFMPRYGTVSQVFLQLVVAQGSSYSCSEGSSYREWTVYFHQNHIIPYKCFSVTIAYRHIISTI